MVYARYVFIFCKFRPVNIFFLSVLCNCLFFMDALVCLSMINLMPCMPLLDEDVLVFDADPSNETELNITLPPTTTSPPITEASYDSSANLTDSQSPVAFIETGSTKNSTEEIPLENPGYETKGKKRGLEPWQYLLTFGGTALLSMAVILVLMVCFRRSKGSKSISDEAVRPEETSKKKEKEGKRPSSPPPEPSKIQNCVPMPVYIAQKSPTKEKSQREKSREDKSTREALRSAKEVESADKKSSWPPPQLSKIQDRAPMPIYDIQKSMKETSTKDTLKSAKVVGMADIKLSKEPMQSAREPLFVAEAPKTPRALPKDFLSKLSPKHPQVSQFAKENSLTNGSSSTGSTTTGSSTLSALSSSSTRLFSSGFSSSGTSFPPVKEIKKLPDPFSRGTSPLPSKGLFHGSQYFGSSLVSAKESLAKSSKSAKR